MPPHLKIWKDEKNSVVVVKQCLICKSNIRKKIEVLNTYQFTKECYKETLGRDLTEFSKILKEEIISVLQKLRIQRMKEHVSIYFIK